jgi:uncharacterized 2Fe-2S/4Fe-4S cluster protein (DUF4445 family)
MFLSSFCVLSLYDTENFTEANMLIKQENFEEYQISAATAASQRRSLLTLLRERGAYLPALCGGRGTCGKCRVLCGELPVSTADRARFSQAELAAGFRLACAAYPAGEVSVVIPEAADEQSFSALTDFDAGKLLGAAVEKPPYRYAIGVDLGTTTIAFALLDAHSGAVLSTLSMLNEQRKWGADVISRIDAANSGELQRLSESVRGQIGAGIAALCPKVSDTALVAVAGNTTMLHILHEFSCQHLGRAPFTPVSLDFVTRPYSALFDGDLAATVVTLPGISTYVGADIVADILFADLLQTHENALLIDIGTNGEMALLTAGRLLCTATAAGPAFEGGNLLWGTGGVSGAIAKARYENGGWELETIGGCPPVGICGSGVVDVVWQGLKNDLILPSGRLNQRDELAIDELVLAKTTDGRDITLHQKDVREVQLAKSAIRSGLDALLHHAGLDYDAIDTLYLAGGFAYHLNPESAGGIGLLPPQLLPKLKQLGNGALAGALLYALNPAKVEPLKRIVALSEAYPLPEDPYFNTLFIENLTF